MYPVFHSKSRVVAKPLHTLDHPAMLVYAYRSSQPPRLMYINRTLTTCFYSLFVFSLVPVKLASARHPT